MSNILKRLWRDRRGTSAVEYGLIAALIVIAMIGSFIQVAGTTTTMWNNVNTTIENSRTGS